MFFDLDRLHGLKAGKFQEQLEQVLADTPVVLVLITPKPSGEDEVRYMLSSTETMQEYDKLGQTDYCRVEVGASIAAEKLVIPLYLGKYGESFIGDQLWVLDGLRDVEGLKAENAYPCAILPAPTMH